jgi:hypothetical protein
MFTPKDHQLEPCDMTWWSLTCNIAREWRLMMVEARAEVAPDRHRLGRLLPQRNPASSTLPKRSEFAENGVWA